MDWLQLITLRESADAARQQIRQIARCLSGHRPLPLVLRHRSQTPDSGYRAEVEVRRWSETPFLRLNSPSPSKEGPWVIDALGNLGRLQLQRRRWLRQSPEEQVYDEIYEVQEEREPGPRELIPLLRELLRQQCLQYWPLWPQLNQLQRDWLISTPQPWAPLQEIFESLPEIAAQALPEILQRQPEVPLRAGLLQAGVEGAYAPPVECLPWLLLQSEWNRCPGLGGLLSACLRAHPQQGWKLRTHPNPQLRGRLLWMLPIDSDWSEWLGEEADPDIRRSLELRLELRTGSPQARPLFINARQRPAKKAAYLLE